MNTDRPPTISGGRGELDNIQLMGDADASGARLVGSTFAGRYRIVQLLRGGGLTNVYLAEPLSLRPDPISDRPNPTHVLSGPITPRTAISRTGRTTRLALKVLRDRFREDRGVVRRFERGVAAAADVVHPNVVRTGPLEHLPDGTPFCTMELLIGLDLADTLAQSRPLAQTRAVRIAEQAALGLSAAHGAGVIHLDVKPENIFLVHQDDGTELIKMLDFGLACIQGDATGARNGTPEYMAPEQRRAAPAAPTMDVFALGVVLHEMLSGHSPTAPRWLAADIPFALSKIIHRATAPDPAERFPSIEDFRRALIESGV